MNCANCGWELAGNETQCPNCGQAVRAAAPPPTTAPPQTSQPIFNSPTSPPVATPQPTYPTVQPRASYANVPNYLVQSILVTVFCSSILGIVSIVFAAQVNGKLSQGDIAGAQDMSNKAKMFCWIAFGVGLLFRGGWFLLMLLGNS